MSINYDVNEETFEGEVLQSEVPVLVDFGAQWCGPCKMLDPIVEELAEEWDGSVKVVKIDVDSNQILTVNHHVMGVPTLMLFVGGEIKERITGYLPKDRILEKMSPYLA